MRDSWWRQGQPAPEAGRRRSRRYERSLGKRPVRASPSPLPSFLTSSPDAPPRCSAALASPSSRPSSTPRSSRTISSAARLARPTLRAARQAACGATREEGEGGGGRSMRVEEDGAAEPDEALALALGPLARDAGRCIAAFVLRKYARSYSCSGRRRGRERQGRAGRPEREPRAGRT